MAKKSRQGAPVGIFLYFNVGSTMDGINDVGDERTGIKMARDRGIKAS